MYSVEQLSHSDEDIDNIRIKVAICGKYTITISVYWLVNFEKTVYSFGKHSVLEW
jgi:hypothetical protein